MTPEESTMLNDLVTKIKQTQLPEKDDEAEQFLKQSLAGTPDAQYILAQSVLVQNIALDQAKGQIRQLQQQLQEAEMRAQAQPQPPAQHTSFLGSLLGRHDQPAVPPPPPQGFSPQGYPPRPPRRRSITRRLRLTRRSMPPPHPRRRHHPEDPAFCALPQLPPPASPPGRWPLRASNPSCTASATAEAALAEAGSAVEASEAIARSRRRSSTTTTKIPTRTSAAKGAESAKRHSTIAATASATTIAEPS